MATPTIAIMLENGKKDLINKKFNTTLIMQVAIIGFANTSGFSSAENKEKNRLVHMIGSIKKERI